MRTADVEMGVRESLADFRKQETNGVVGAVGSGVKRDDVHWAKVLVG
jgi:hypothetical protein